jgi:ABC-type multidrug transport system fused ATPase/permease subunit
MEAIKAIQSYGAEKRENLFFHRLAACLFRDSVNVQWYANMLGLQSEILAHLANCAILLYGGKLVLDGEMSMGKLLFVQVTSQNLFQPVLEFSNLSFILQRLRVALLRCASVLDQKPEIVDAPDSVPFPTPIRKSIEIKHLKFTYPTKDLNREETEKIANPTEDNPEEEEPTTTHTPVLRDINLTVPAGTWLCIMGASGSGKTTLLHLLARLYKPDSGEILLDGIPLDKISTSSLRRAMGVIPQEAQIFSGTIRDNIAYGKPDATNAEILEAAKAAQMHDVIMKMNIKYETIVGQRGSSLSGGQRQRLSLARALLSKPELLILDDCTSALDANTERKIQETLTELLQGRTAIMVSQRISMAMRCHQICVLENGVVSECGTHKELLANHGFYARLYAQQTGQSQDR